MDTLTKAHPSHDIIDQALMLQAQILESEADYTGAAQKYQTILKEFSTEILADDACFALAELQRKAFNAPEKALLFYEKIIFEHQDSIHFVDAKKHYRRLLKLSNSSSKNNL